MIQHGLIHAANAIYLASLSVKDLMWLRWLNIISSLFLFPYYFSYHMEAPMIWNAIFLGINAYRLIQHLNKEKSNVKRERFEQEHRDQKDSGSEACAAGEGAL